MPKKSAITNEARVKILLELGKSTDGLVLTKLNQKLAWKKADTKRVLDDLEFSGMAFADDISRWSFARQKKLGYLSQAPVFEVSPKGYLFLSLWKELEKLRSTKGWYGKYRFLLEGKWSKFNKDLIDPINAALERERKEKTENPIRQTQGVNNVKESLNLK